MTTKTTEPDFRAILTAITALAVLLNRKLITEKGVCCLSAGGAVWLKLLNET